LWWACDEKINKLLNFKKDSNVNKVFFDGEKRIFRRNQILIFIKAKLLLGRLVSGLPFLCFLPYVNACKNIIEKSVD
jgi:hypothetical protein